MKNSSTLKIATNLLNGLFQCEMNVSDETVIS